MINDEWWDLRKEFVARYPIDVEVGDWKGETMTVQRWADGLLDQLEAAVKPGAAGPDAAGGGGYGSRPPVRVGAVSLHAEITRTLKGWAVHFTGRRTPTAYRALSELGRVLPAIQYTYTAAMVSKMTDWRTRMRWVLGWESPPFAPRVPCPQCLALGMLRCWPTETWVECLVCRSYWTAETLGELRDRLRLSRELTHAR